MNFIRFVYSCFFLLLMLISFNSCSIESAKAPEEKKLIILSDYLQNSDTILFRNFILKEHISVEIFNMESNRIIGLMRNQGNNVQADLILTKSLYDMHKMYRRELLQDLFFEDEIDPNTLKISSIRYRYIGLGIDPFIIANSHKKKVRTYNELTEYDFINTLGEQELTPMLSPVSSKLERVKANRWIQAFSQHKRSIKSISDTLRNNLPILTTYSEYNTNTDSLFQFKERFLTYPNGRSSGTFYNVRAAGIIHQAQNYNSAKKFLSFYAKMHNNLRFNESIHTLSIFEESAPFRRYKTPPEELVKYYQTVDRVLHRIN